MTNNFGDINSLSSQRASHRRHSMLSAITNTCLSTTWRHLYLFTRGWNDHFYATLFQPTSDTTSRPDRYNSIVVVKLDRRDVLSREETFLLRVCLCRTRPSRFFLRPPAAARLSGAERVALFAMTIRMSHVTTAFALLARGENWDATYRSRDRLPATRVLNLIVANVHYVRRQIPVRANSLRRRAVLTRPTHTLREKMSGN